MVSPSGALNVSLEILENECEFNDGRTKMENTNEWLIIEKALLQRVCLHRGGIVKSVIPLGQLKNPSVSAINLEQYNLITDSNIIVESQEYSEIENDDHDDDSWMADLDNDLKAVDAVAVVTKVLSSWMSKKTLKIACEKIISKYTLTSESALPILLQVVSDANILEEGVQQLLEKSLLVIIYHLNCPVPRSLQYTSQQIAKQRGALILSAVVERWLVDDAPGLSMDVEIKDVVTKLQWQCDVIGGILSSIRDSNLNMFSDFVNKWFGPKAPSLNHSYKHFLWLTTFVMMKPDLEISHVSMIVHEFLQYCTSAVRESFPGFVLKFGNIIFTFLVKYEPLLKNREDLLNILQQISQVTRGPLVKRIQSKLQALSGDNIL